MSVVQVSIADFSNEISRTSAAIFFWYAQRSTEYVLRLRLLLWRLYVYTLLYQYVNVSLSRPPDPPPPFFLCNCNDVPVRLFLLSCFSSSMATTTPCKKRVPLWTKTLFFFFGNPLVSPTLPNIPLPNICITTPELIISPEGRTVGCFYMECSADGLV